MKHLIILFSLLFSFSSFADNNKLVLVCKSPKGITLRMNTESQQESFKKDGFSKAVLVILFLNNQMSFSWNQSLQDFNNSDFKPLNVVQSNSNMALGVGRGHNDAGIEGIRIHLRKKTAIYFKHIAPAIDGFGTDGIYKMKCKDETSKFV